MKTEETYYRLEWINSWGEKGCSDLFYGAGVDEDHMQFLVETLNKEYPGWKHSYKKVVIPKNL